MTQGTSIAFSSLWPEALAIVAAVLCLWGLSGTATKQSPSWLRVRALSFTGLLASAYLVYLGLWPSFFSMGAVIVAPAVITFSVLIFRPVLFARWYALRIYLVASVVLSLLSALFELVWLVHLRWKN